ncbi:MAG: GxxExxY protein, partial [Candidatus Thiosymbion ectosymbiont of Robbea hypermnestra]|nr:GxxExxY protein [Candidatus Thiosymbion ectosymbiont of Robbea hypermnestra]
MGAADAVHNGLGSGFLEKVDENAMAVELRSRRIAFRTQAPLKVTY